MSTPDLPAFRLVQATFPDRLVSRIEPEELPAGWDAYPYTPASQRVGDQWFDDGRHAALLVPSSLVPGVNVLVNPRHPAFARLEPGDEPRGIPYARRASG